MVHQGSRQGTGDRIDRLEGIANVYSGNPASAAKAFATHSENATDGVTRYWQSVAACLIWNETSTTSLPQLNETWVAVILDQAGSLREAKRFAEAQALYYWVARGLLDRSSGENENQVFAAFAWMEQIAAQTGNINAINKAFRQAVTRSSRLALRFGMYAAYTDFLLQHGARAAEIELIFRRQWTESPQKDPMFLIAPALMLIRIGDQSGALTFLQEASKHSGDQYYELFHAWGRYYAEHGQIDRAEPAYRRSIALALATSPGAAAEISSELALTLADHGRDRDAIQLQRQAVGWLARSPEHWYRLGRLLEVDHQMGAAHEAYLQALKLNPGYAEALNAVRGLDR